MNRVIPSEVEEPRGASVKLFSGILQLRFALLRMTMFVRL